MSRVKRGNIAKKRKIKIFKLTKGFQGSHSVIFRTANQQGMKSLFYAYQDRRTKKRNFRKIWINRLNAGIRHYGFNYSCFIFKLKQSNILLNRKMLSQLLIFDKKAFTKLIDLIK
uniref:Large ribosomal subunit protein bL20c n=1 Tax=Verdigellas peltata TaxID=542676 RepID=A0A161KKB1_9VIRI|nr:ribosomal protein L20 [Verdigellas peltata]CZF96695.1 ribosomal protein L20 [Verdigellas peltata]